MKENLQFWEIVSKEAIIQTVEVQRINTVQTGLSVSYY